LPTAFSVFPTQEVVFGVLRYNYSIVGLVSQPNAAFPAFFFPPGMVWSS